MSLKLNECQVKYLNEYFGHTTHPTKLMRMAISQDIKCTETQVRLWFLNKNAMTRKMEKQNKETNLANSSESVLEVNSDDSISKQ
ncbi:hypothetical protein CAEBREN_24066 [Caenorhabditis brenneri]|uniref:Homeobox domain-containing protein n=1 Tax=Caenorhabditis brenneri TaxID=135651 RepID=G0N1Y5_CAEBE|nr:hypothetical protein CAEBREN_24066 [Caenorhabditis brenneri]